MDLSRSFAYGQGYVALSRVRTLDGLHLLGWNHRALTVDPAIREEDAILRRQSAQAEQTWQARSLEEQKKQQERFIIACDGKRKGKSPAEIENIELPTNDIFELIGVI